jgi:hypothetical protein
MRLKPVRQELGQRSDEPRVLLGAHRPRGALKQPQRAILPSRPPVAATWPACAPAGCSGAQALGPRGPAVHPALVELPGGSRRSLSPSADGGHRARRARRTLVR